jgi:hypothetical protein
MLNISESVPATGNYTHTFERKVMYIRTIRAQYVTKGANTTAKLQGSFDGTTYEDLQTIAAGYNNAVSCRHPYLKISFDNTDASPEANEMEVMTEWDKDSVEIGPA